MITTPEIICDVFSFLDKDQIERIQVVNQFWNNVIIRHKNILPLRQFFLLCFAIDNYYYNRIVLYVAKEYLDSSLHGYIIEFDGTNLSKIEKDEDLSSRYSQLTADEVLTNLIDVVYDSIRISDFDSEDHQDNLLNLMKLVTTKTGDRFRGKFGSCIDYKKNWSISGSKKLVEIFDNYIIVDKLALGHSHASDSYIRQVCANPKIVQWPSTPKEISLEYVRFNENEEVLNFTCNGKLNGANRVTIFFKTPDTNYGNFFRQWFELYRTQENPISLVGKFELLVDSHRLGYSVLDTVKTFLSNTQLRIKYSLETKEFHRYPYVFTNQFLVRRCVLHETDSYALVIEMAYDVKTDMSSIKASDLDQPPCDQMKTISFCVKSL